MILREISCLFFRFVSWSHVLGLMIYQLYMAIFEILKILFYLKTQYFYLNTPVVIIIEYANKWTISPEEIRMNGQNYEMEKELDKQGSRVSIKHPAGEPILSCRGSRLVCRSAPQKLDRYTVLAELTWPPF